MNKLIFLLDIKIWILLVGTILIISCDSAPNQSDIHGVWKGEHLGMELMFEFKNDGTCILNFMDNVSDTTIILIGNFEVNFSKTPIPLSIRNISEVNHPLHTIVEFVKVDSIKLANFAPRWRIRPISFFPTTNMNLRRVNEI